MKMALVCPIFSDMMKMRRGVLTTASAIVVLLLAQWYVARISQRILNLPMLAATIAVAAIAVWGVVALINEQNSLSTAQQQGSDPVEVLSASTVLLSRAQGDLSLALVSRGTDETDQTDLTAVERALTPLTAKSQPARRTGTTAAADRFDVDYASYQAQTNRIKYLQANGELPAAIALEPARRRCPTGSAATSAVKSGRAGRVSAPRPTNATSALGGLGFAIPLGHRAGRGGACSVCARGSTSTDEIAPSPPRSASRWSRRGRGLRHDLRPRASDGARGARRRLHHRHVEASRRGGRRAPRACARRRPCRRRAHAAGQLHGEDPRRGYLIAGVNAGPLELRLPEPAHRTRSRASRSTSCASWPRRSSAIAKGALPPRRADRAATRSRSSQQGKVDVVVDAVTITCARRKEVDFSTVYYDAQQRVLVPTSSAGRQHHHLGRQAGLRERRVDPDRGDAAPIRAAPIPSARPRRSIAWCCLQEGQDRRDLHRRLDPARIQDAGPQHQDRRARSLADVPYGMAISKAHPDFVRFVNGVLAELRAERDMAAGSYDQWLGRSGSNPSPLRPASIRRLR